LIFITSNYEFLEASLKKLEKTLVYHLLCRIKL